MPLRSQSLKSANPLKYFFGTDTLRQKQHFDRWRQRGVQLLLAVAGIAVALLSLELAARLLPLPESLFTNYGDTYVCSPTLGWLGRPNYRGVITREEYSHPIQFNAAGMYDSDHSRPKPENTFRILWMGDSFAQTLQVDESQTAHQQLENLLNQRLGRPERKFEVISAGVIGWSTGQELLYYRQMGRRYQPDLALLLFFMGNDVEDNLPGHALTINGFNCFAPYFPVCQNGQLDSQPWYYIPGVEPAWEECPAAKKWLTGSLSWVQQNSQLFARLEPLLLSRVERRTYGQEFGLPFAALYLPQESAEVRYGWQVAEELLSQFNREAAADGADFGVAIIGPEEVIWLSQLSDTQLQSFRQSDPILAQAEIDRPNRRLKNFLQGQSIPVVDLQQPMIDYIAATGAQLYLPIDRHWTAEGNRLAAELIFEWLVENELVNGN